MHGIGFGWLAGFGVSGFAMDREWGGSKWLLLYHGVDICCFLIVRCIHWVGVVGYSGEGVEGWMAEGGVLSCVGGHALCASLSSVRGRGGFSFLFGVSR